MPTYMVSVSADIFVDADDPEQAEYLVYDRDGLYNIVVKAVVERDEDEEPFWEDGPDEEESYD